jgi:hypothetical protein
MSSDAGSPPAALTIGDLRVVVADIPVRRRHHMSFTTLETVNFVFVRLRPLFLTRTNRRRPQDQDRRTLRRARRGADSPHP